MATAHALEQELEFVIATYGDEAKSRATEIRAELARLKGDVEHAVSGGPKAMKKAKD